MGSWKLVLNPYKLVEWWLCLEMLWLTISEWPSWNLVPSDVLSMDSFVRVFLRSFEKFSWIRSCWPSLFSTNRCFCWRYAVMLYDGAGFSLNLNLESNSGRWLVSGRISFYSRLTRLDTFTNSSFDVRCSARSLKKVKLAGSLFSSMLQVFMFSKLLKLLQPCEAISRRWRF